MLIPQIANEPDAETTQLLILAMHALRSYQHGNASPDLAEEVASKIQKATKHAHFCHCGTANKPGIHLIGHCGCIRFMTEAPIQSDSGKWLVDGAEITDYTLIHQRGYHKHECGCWSRHPGSHNSIEA